MHTVDQYNCLYYDRLPYDPLRVVLNALQPLHYIISYFKIMSLDYKFELDN